MASLAVWPFQVSEKDKKVAVCNVRVKEIPRGGQHQKLIGASYSTGQTAACLLRILKATFPALVQAARAYTSAQQGIL